MQPLVFSLFNLFKLVSFNQVTDVHGDLDATNEEGKDFFQIMDKVPPELNAVIHQIIPTA